MKKLILLVMVIILTGCSQFTAITPNTQIQAIDGNKIYAYQDIEADGEKTTIVIARIEGEDPGGKLAEIMESIQKMFSGE